MTGFREKVCESKGDNRDNCAPTIWGSSSQELAAAVDNLLNVDRQLDTG